MQTLPISRLDVRVRIHKLQRIKRSLAESLKRRTMTRTRYVESTSKLWDRIILFLFACSSVVFFRAFLGLGKVNEDMRALNNTFVYPRASLSVPSPPNQGLVTPNGDQRTHRQGLSRVMVGWDRNHELLPGSPSATVLPASIPQDAFPDPTPTVVRAEDEQALQQVFLPVTTHANTPADVPYDPFRRAFDGGVEGGGYRGLYPVAGPPRTPLPSVRTRRFGRCLVGEACL